MSQFGWGIFGRRSSTPVTARAARPCGGCAERPLDQAGDDVWPGDRQPGLRKVQIDSPGLILRAGLTPALCIWRILERAMKLENYKTILYRQEDGSWVAEIPAILGCYALMDTREAALSELTHVFQLIADEYREKGLKLPADTTEIVNA